MKQKKICFATKGTTHTHTLRHTIKPTHKSNNARFVTTSRKFNKMFLYLLLLLLVVVVMVVSVLFNIVYHLAGYRQQSILAYIWQRFHLQLFTGIFIYFYVCFTLSPHFLFNVIAHLFFICVYYFRVPLKQKKK